jgi:solute carrier family 50 protein (sugar transporter)
VISDPFIAPANIVGTIAGIFFTMTALPCCPRKLSDVVTGLFLATAGMFGILSMVHTFALDATGQKRMW